MPPEVLARIMSIEGQIAAPEAELLYERASQATVCIVEIGSFRGRSTVALALGSKAGNGVPVYAIDPHEQAGEGEYPYGPADRVAWMRNVLDAGVADIVRMVNLPSAVLDAGFYEGYDLVWIDGDHDGSQPWHDLVNAVGGMRPHGHILMHDRHAQGVQLALANQQQIYPDKMTVVDCVGSIVEIWRK